jgi:IS6 family transposase
MREDSRVQAGTVALAAGVGIRETLAMRSRRHSPVRQAPSSAFAEYRFPPEVITLAVRWYLRFGLSYRDVEELLAERGIEVDHVSIYRWVHRFAPEFAEASRAQQDLIGDRCHVDETYPEGRRGVALPVPGHRPVRPSHRRLPLSWPGCQSGPPLPRESDRSDRISPVEVTTDRYRVYPRVLDELLPAAFHDTEVHANNALETDHGRLKARLRPMRGLKRDRTARVIVATHAFVQNLRRGFYDLGSDATSAPPSDRRVR